MSVIVLEEGSEGPDVKRLQMLLNSALTPSPQLALDGSFGAATARAVKRFQRSVGLKQDGIVGSQTWTRLGMRGSVAPVEPPPAGGVGAPWMELAELELGVVEDVRPGHHTQRIVDYHQTTSLRATTDEVPWCSSFVNWVVEQAGLDGTDNALAKSWLKWGRELKTPRKGAITVLKKKGATSDAATGSATGYHVAFYVSSTPTHIRLLGGNQRNEVRYSTYALSAYSIEGFRWPK